MKTCNCYVMTLPDYEAYAIRVGAHTLKCPIYRPAVDDVDAIGDNITRNKYLRTRCTHIQHRDGVDCGHRSFACHVDCPCCTLTYVTKLPLMTYTPYMYA